MRGEPSCETPHKGHEDAKEIIGRVLQCVPLRASVVKKNWIKDYGQTSEARSGSPSTKPRACWRGRSSSRQAWRNAFVRVCRVGRARRMLRPGQTRCCWPAERQSAPNRGRTDREGPLRQIEKRQLAAWPVRDR